MNTGHVQGYSPTFPSRRACARVCIYVFLKIDDIWVRGLYDPDTSNDESATIGLGATCVEINDSGMFAGEQGELMLAIAPEDLHVVLDERRRGNSSSRALQECV